ncbi:hypothetical protein SAMN05444484_102752 [Flavobacterium chilense]|uniref:Uncharacterized protein n=2 Tax=Flavobacterium chilense TaxID=946677 RepID=A0A1M7DWA3_9FLAO|nr:hypothetical protein SAMN05444484_102752 [Flavobacterium chilense]
MIYVLFPVWLLGNKALAQVGATNNSPDKTAILDLRKSTSGGAIANKGLLIPQVSLVSLTSTLPIATTPATSLLVYNTNAAITGGKGYYYWESNTWKKLTNMEDLTGDNLGNHTATMNLNMSGFDINAANKTSTQTEAIALGTDSAAPQPGNVATAADTQGNIVWKPLPEIEANASGLFVLKSTGSSISTSTLNSWITVPGLSGLAYIPSKNGYVIIKATVFIAMSDITSPGIATAMFQSGVRFTASTGGIPIADPRGSVVTYGEIHGSSQSATSNSGKNPVGLVIFTQFPVTAGTSYTFTIETANLYKYNNVGGTSIAGSFTDYGGTPLVSYMMGTFMAN